MYERNALRWIEIKQMLLELRLDQEIFRATHLPSKCLHRLRLQQNTNTARSVAEDILCSSKDMQTLQSLLSQHGYHSYLRHDAGEQSRVHNCESKYALLY
jgi:predicted patatin/cPLA2 family phospholipase